MPRSIERGFVKVCGVTRVGDALKIADSGASAIGLILADSPRRVSLLMAQEISESIRDTILRCAVFRDVDDHDVRISLDALDVELVQIHGTLSEVLERDLRDRQLTIVKALNIDDSEFLEFDDARVDAVLIDGPRPGSGSTHSWTRLRERNFTVPTIAAGGVGPQNVAEVVASTRTWGVDSASGVESAPGVKDLEKVRAYVSNARAAFATMGT